MTLEDQIVRFIQAYAPGHPHRREAFRDNLRDLLEAYGHAALAHGNLPDTEHEHNPEKSVIKDTQ